MNLFLDLEGVIIDDWFSCLPLWQNLRGIKKYIEMHKPNKIFIFSGAVWDINDKTKCENHLVPFIEREIGQQIDEVISMQDAVDRLQPKVGFFDSITDVLACFGKDHLCELYVRKFHPSERSTLIDDSFGNRHCFFRDKNCTGDRTMFTIFDSADLDMLL